MKGMSLNGVFDLTVDKNPLVMSDIPIPTPGPDEVLIRISCCGVCHTELDEIEGRTPPPAYPVIPGHQVIGRVVSDGRKFRRNDRVGVAWIYSSCGKCAYCLSGRENLCPAFLATGRDRNGGYAEFMVIQEQFAYAIPDQFKDEDAAPLLCAGAIGYRSLKLSNLADGQTLCLSGFGASGHLVLKMARALYPHSRIIVFARSEEEQNFSRMLGADWAGSFDEDPKEFAQAAIDTTPAWHPIVQSLRWLAPGGRLVINAIRKEASDQTALLELDYAEHLWKEKEIKSVANITPKDVEDFLSLAATASIKPEIEIYELKNANRALADLKKKHVKGAKVLMVS